MYTHVYAKIYVYIRRAYRKHMAQTSNDPLYTLKNVCIRIYMVNQFAYIRFHSLIYRIYTLEAFYIPSYTFH
jgi:hypothetical protein